MLFFDTNTTSKYIKNMLRSTNLPIIDFAHPGKFLFKDALYIYRNRVIKCIKEGFLEIGPNAEKVNNIYPDIDVLPSSDLILKYTPLDSGLCEYEPIQYIKFGDKIPYITENILLNGNTYDSDTHENLGRYLDYLDAFSGVNLFPFYNCFSYRSVKGDNASYKYFLIPIDLNQVYTFAVENGTSIYYKPVLFNSKTEEIKEINKEEFGDTSSFREVCLNNLSFNNPAYIEINSKNNELYKYRKYIYLQIRMLKSVKSSIVMLKGKYKNKNKRAEYFGKINDINKNHILLSNLSLLRISDGIQHPFANRLIEYLLDNVITPIDEIPENISKYMNAFYNRDDKLTEFLDYDRCQLLHSYIENSKRECIDMNGFIDSDMEKYLMEVLNYGSSTR